MIYIVKKEKESKENKIKQKEKKYREVEDRDGDGNSNNNNTIEKQAVQEVKEREFQPGTVYVCVRICVCAR